MKPVDQTQFEPNADDPAKTGNCLSACIASILELPIEDVPTFAAHEDWWERAVAWLDERGHTIWPIPTWILDALTVSPDALDCWYIACGKSPRGDFNHGVVASGAHIAHDPHPSRDGLDGPVREAWIVTPNAAPDEQRWSFGRQVDLVCEVRVA